MAERGGAERSTLDSHFFKVFPTRCAVRESPSPIRPASAARCREVKNDQQTSFNNLEAFITFSKKLAANSASLAEGAKVVGREMKFVQDSRHDEIRDGGTKPRTLATKINKMRLITAKLLY